MPQPEEDIRKPAKVSACVSERDLDPFCSDQFRGGGPLHSLTAIKIALQTQSRPLDFVSPSNSVLSIFSHLDAHPIN